MTGRRPSQCEVMWALLQDGRWHSDATLWDAGIGRPNSRAAELRARHGATIEHRRDPDEAVPSRAHQYRLVVDPPATADGQLLLVDAA